jgi:hypothetical protein
MKFIISLLVSYTIGASQLLENMVKFDSAVAEYVYVSSATSAYAFRFGSVAQLKEATDRAQGHLSAQTVEALSQVISSTIDLYTDTKKSWRSPVTIGPIDRIHIVGAVLSVLNEALIDETVETRMKTALSTLRGVGALNYQGLFFRAQSDSDIEDVEVVPASPKVERLPWLKLTEQLNSVRLSMNERVANILCVFIHSSLKAIFGGLDGAEKLADLTQLLVDYAREREDPSELSFLYSIDLGQVEAVSRWLNPEPLQPFLDRMQAILAVETMIDSLISSEGFDLLRSPRPVSGSLLDSPKLRASLFKMPTEFLLRYVELEVFVREHIDNLVKFLALNTALESSTAKTELLEELVNSIFETRPLRISSDPLQRVLSLEPSPQNLEYATTLMSLHVCIELAADPSQRAPLEQTLVRLVLFERDLDNKRYIISGFLPALSAIEDFLKTM